MRLVVMAQGKIRERHFRDACSDYQNRIAHFLPIEVKEVSRLSAPPAAHLAVALDAGGLSPDSAEFARWLGRGLQSGKKGITFLLGGPDGIPASLLESANDRLSLSRLTMAHRLARVVLLEQIYRALTILRGVPYHR